MAIASISSGWSTQPSAHSTWNSGILLDVPPVLNAYPPGLGYGAWRTSTSPKSSSALSYSDASTSIGTKRSRPPLRSNRRTPPPPAARSRLLISQPDDPFGDSYSSVLAQDENNVILYKSAGHALSPSPIRIIIPTPNHHSSSRFNNSKQFHSPPELDGQLAKQRAAADKEARLKVIASILLNRVNVVGKPMRRRPGQQQGVVGKEYVRSSLGRCVAVAE